MVEKTYQRLSFRKIIRTIGTLGVPIVFALWLLISQAQAQSISLISDEEAEQLLEGIIRPLFDAANLRYNRNEIHIVNDPTLNAFVSDGNNLFIHTGTIINATSPNELAGVIAHETGHIHGGHIMRQKLKNQSLQEVSFVSA
ncbi:MAG: M48 family metalloprotease, partial [Alphaproteobacteria bacterium]|nr:M48 family metalloprotease [Alphaproteobacteria bacterium]